VSFFAVFDALNGDFAVSQFTSLIGTIASITPFFKVLVSKKSRVVLPLLPANKLYLFCAAWQAFYLLILSCK
jgi:hypothetical protein